MLGTLAKNTAHGFGHAFGEIAANAATNKIADSEKAISWLKTIASILLVTGVAYVGLRILYNVKDQPLLKLPDWKGKLLS